jgi:hypothetical protein
MLPTIARVGVRHGVSDECVDESGKSNCVGHCGTEAVAKVSRWQSFPPLAALPQIGLGFCRWGTVASFREPSAPTFFYCAVRRGLPTANGLSAPDQGANQDPSGRWTILVGDQPNILPLNLILYFKL